MTEAITEYILNARRFRPKDPSHVLVCPRARIAQSTLKARAAINVGIAAAKSNFPGWTTPSLK